MPPGQSADAVDSGAKRKDSRPPRWRSARELQMKVSAIAPGEQQAAEKLDAVLHEILNTFPRLSLHILPVVLLSKHKMSLASAVRKLESSGFARHVKGLRTESVAAVARSAEKSRRFAIKWNLEDFELVLEVWSGLEDCARNWLSRQFLRFWQSRSGEEELRADGAEEPYGTTVWRFKCIWIHSGPAPMNLKLEPAKAIGLGWASKDVEDLLRDFVDVNGDCAALVEDLQSAGHLTPALVSAHEGLLSACIDVCPEFLVGQMLVGQVSLASQDGKNPHAPSQHSHKSNGSLGRRAPQASLVLRLVEAAARVVAGWGSEGGLRLTDQQAKHLKALLQDVVGACADKSIAMLQAQPHILELVLCLDKKQGLAPMLCYVSGLYIGATRPSDFVDRTFNDAVARLDRDVSRRALVVMSREEREGRAGQSDRQVDSFAALMTDLLAEHRRVDMETLVQLQQCRHKQVDDALRQQLHRWTLRQIAGGARYSASTLKGWLERWVRPVCSGAQACEVFGAMAEALDSWTFVLDVAASLGDAVFAQRPPAEQALVECVYHFIRRKFAECQEQLSSSPPLPSNALSPRDAILKALLRLHPQQFAADVDARCFVRVRKLSDRGAVPRKLFSPLLADERALSEGSRWQFALDSFCPIECFRRGFIEAPEYARVEKTKTKEQWAEVVQVVGFVTPELLTDPRTAQRLSALLCAPWSHHEVWALLCSDLALKLLQAAALCTQPAPAATGSPLPAPGEVLLNFTLKCPHEHFAAGVSKRDWVVSLLAAAHSRLGGLEARTVSSLVQAHGSGGAEELAALVHASGAAEVCEATEELFFRLLPSRRPAPEGGSGKGQAAPRPLLEQVQLLLRTRFNARATLRAEGRGGECVDCGGAEFWEELERADGGGEGGEERGFALVSEWEGALESEAVVLAETENRRRPTLAAEDSVYRRFGERGAQVVRGWLQGATATEVLGVLQEFGSKAAAFVSGGGEDMLLKHWRPQHCAAEEAPAMVQLLVEHAPQLWGRCGQLVWEQEGLEVSAANSQLLRRLLRKRVPDLGLLPQRWWHCLDVASLAHHCVATLKDDSPLRRLAEARVPLELSDVRGLLEGGSLAVETQALLLDVYAADAASLAELLPLYAGPILGHLERLFKLLDEDAATVARLVESGDGVGEEERQTSGWNKVLNALLTGIRARIRGGTEGNWLHSEEQLALFSYCCDKSRADAALAEALPDEPKLPKWLLSQGNAAVLADLLGPKCVDPLHLARIVNLVLSAARPQMVRDAALRAMVRLGAEERAALIDRLLASPRKLPLGVLFALTVTDLSEAAAGVVVLKVEALAPAELDALVDLVRDANPAAADSVHTFPRRPVLQRALCQRFLLRYVAGDPLGAPGQKAPARRARDARFLRLYLACCEPARARWQLLELLERQLLRVTPLLLTAFERGPAADAGGEIEAEEWEALVAHMGGSLRSFLPWLWRQALARSADGHALPLLQAALRQAAAGGAEAAAAVLQDMIEWGEGSAAGGGAGQAGQGGVGGALLVRVAGAGELVRRELLALSGRGEEAAEGGDGGDGGEGGAMLARGDVAALWVRWLAISWALEQRPAAPASEEVLQRRARQLAEALPELLVEGARGAAGNKDGGTSRGWWDASAGQRVLTAAVVRRLGVDVEARVLLVQIVPQTALECWGAEVLLADPSFAAALSDLHYHWCLRRLPSLQPSSDKSWPLLRRVLAALLAAQRHDRALPLSIALAKASKEAQDVEVVTAAFGGVGAQQRRRTRLVEALQPLWPQYGALLQAAVDAAAQHDRAGSTASTLGLEARMLERMDLVD